MRGIRGLAALGAAALLSLSFGATHVARASSGTHRTYGRTQQAFSANALRRHKHHAGRFSWSQHDKAVYAVSTLNAPLCSNGEQLSTVLWNNDGARIFDVMKSSRLRRLYFVQVRTAATTLIGVYAYRFGWKLPEGVEAGQCVTDVSATIGASYKARDWKFVARFGSTYPQS